MQMTDAAGNYNANVIVDSQNEDNQRNTSNDGQNDAGVPFTVQAAATLADLLPQSRSVSPTSVKVGSAVTVGYTVRNQGGTNAPASHTRVQLKTAALVIVADQTFSTVAIAANSMARESR